jgi:hypothetical protein
LNLSQESVTFAEKQKCVVCRLDLLFLTNVYVYVCIVRRFKAAVLGKGGDSDNATTTPSVDASTAATTNANNVGDEGNSSVSSSSSAAATGPTDDIDAAEIALNQQSKPLTKLSERFDKTAKAIVAENESWRQLTQGVADLGTLRCESAQITNAASLLVSLDDSLQPLRSSLATMLRDRGSTALATLAKRDIAQAVQHKTTVYDKARKHAVSTEQKTIKTAMANSVDPGRLALAESERDAARAHLQQAQIEAAAVLNGAQERVDYVISDELLAVLEAYRAFFVDAADAVTPILQRARAARESLAQNPVASAVVSPDSKMSPRPNRLVALVSSLSGGGGGGASSAAAETAAPTPQTRVFGVPLATLMERDRTRQTPLLFSTCIELVRSEGLEFEGIFRLSASKSEMEQSRAQIDSGCDVVKLLTSGGPLLVSNLLKAFLRDLPDPLLTFALHGEWVATAKQGCDVTKLRQLTRQLPETNRVMLGDLLRLLSAVVKAEATTRMSANNLALIFAPTVLRDVDETGTNEFDPTLFAMKAEVIKHLILKADDVLESHDPSLDIAPPKKEAPRRNTSSIELPAAAAAAVPTTPPSAEAPPKSPTRTVPTCKACSQPVRGRGLSVLGGAWHKECFRCTLCGDAFESTFKVAPDNTPYCEACFTTVPQ